MGQVYLGALPALAIIAAGLARGALFARPMRYFTIALALVTLYALGRHTPAFHWIFDHVPGVSFFRRPADATFMIGALGAIVAGYCVHDWLTRPAKDSRQRLPFSLLLPSAFSFVASRCPRDCLDW